MSVKKGIFVVRDRLRIEILSNSYSQVALGNGRARLLVGSRLKAGQWTPPACEAEVRLRPPCSHRSATVRCAPAQCIRPHGITKQKLRKEMLKQR
jgi:hypothetical protein